MWVGGSCPEIAADAPADDQRPSNVFVLVAPDGTPYRYRKIHPFSHADEERYVRAGTNCYDLGCSLGAATLAMQQGIRESGCRIIAIDNSPAMIKRCGEILAEQDRIELRLGDIVYLDGLMYTAREGVYMRAIEERANIPMDLPRESAANFHCSPAATINPEDDFTPPFFFVNDRLRGFLTGVEDDAVR